MTMRCKNLRTGEERSYVGPDARFSVICAYAQGLGDNNTWSYEVTYGSLVKQGRHGWHLGDWSCLFDGR